MNSTNTINVLHSEARVQLYLRYYDRFRFTHSLARAAAKAILAAGRKGHSCPHFKDIYRTEVSALPASVTSGGVHFYQVNGIFPLFPSHVLSFFLDKVFVYSIHILVKKIVLHRRHFLPSGTASRRLVTAKLALKRSNREEGETSWLRKENCTHRFVIPYASSPIVPFQRR